MQFAENNPIKHVWKNLHQHLTSMLFNYAKISSQKYKKTPIVRSGISHSNKKRTLRSMYETL